MGPRTSLYQTQHAETRWTSTKILLITTKTTEIVANKAVQVTCPNAQLAANGGAAADVKFKVKTSVQTAYTALTTGYSVVAAASVTWGSVAVGTARVSLDPVSLALTFKPNKEIATTGTITLTASTAIFAADAATTCTATTTSTATGTSVAVDVATAVVTGSPDHPHADYAECTTVHARL